MSDDVIRAVQATLSELITYALSEQLGNAYGTYITSSIITQFATPYADTVSTNVIQQATPLIRSIGKTCFILGVAHFVNAIALIGSIKLWYMERGRSVRCWLLMLACLSNFISIPVILAAIKGGSEQLRQATPYVAAFFVEGSTGMLILSVLWQAVILWSNPYQMIYRTVSILLVFVYSAIQFYAGVTSFENCVIGKSYACDIHSLRLIRCLRPGVPPATKMGDSWIGDILHRYVHDSVPGLPKTVHTDNEGVWYIRGSAYRRGR